MGLWFFACVCVPTWSASKILNESRQFRIQRVGRNVCRLQDEIKAKRGPCPITVCMYKR